MIDLPQTERSPLPQPDEASAPFWDGLRRGELLLRRCQVCAALSHPAAELCRSCASPLLEWARVRPAGRLYSWTVERRAVIQGMTPPYVIAQVTPVDCDEGDVRLVGTLLADPGTLEIDMPVVLRPVLAPGSDVVIATFVPAEVPGPPA